MTRTDDNPRKRSSLWRWAMAGLLLGAALGYVGRRPTPAGQDRAPPAPAAARPDPGGAAPSSWGSGSAPSAGEAEARAWLDPQHPGYDPALGAAYFKRGSFEVFDGEPRLPRFAERRERFLTETIGPVFERLAPGARLDHVECRSGSCLVMLRLPDNDWSNRVAQSLPWGDTRAVRKVATDDGTIGLEVAAVNHRESLDHDYFERNATGWLKKVEPDLILLREQHLRGTGADPDDAAAEPADASSPAP